MRALLVALVVAVLPGCLTTEKFVYDRPSCQADYVSWAGGLTWSVMQGDGKGSFDYDPAGLETRVQGSYVLQSGDFGYAVSYPPNHWRQGTDVDGFGYLQSNGDLDVEYTAVTTDANDDETTAQIREVRVGCDVEIEAIDNGWYSRTEGTFTSDGFEYERDQDDADWPSGIAYQGVKKADLSWEEDFDAEEAGRALTGTTEGDSSGYTRTEWTLETSDGTAEGYDERFMDGRWHQSYEFAGGTDYEWDVEVDFEGDGGGSYVSGSRECEVVYEDWDCTLDCGSTSSPC